MRKLNLCILNWGWKKIRQELRKKKIFLLNFLRTSVFWNRIKVPVSIVSVVWIVSRQFGEKVRLLQWRFDDYSSLILNPFSCFSEQHSIPSLMNLKLLCHLTGIKSGLRHSQAVPKTPYIQNGSTQSSFHLSIQLNMKHCCIFWL